MKKVMSILFSVLAVLFIGVNLFYCLLCGGSSVKYIISAAVISLVLPAAAMIEWHVILHLLHPYKKEDAK